MQINAYLNFDGHCAAAFRFYERCLGGKIEVMMTHAETPMASHVPAEWGERIMHAQLVVGDAVLMGSDAPPGIFEQPKGFSVALQIAGTAEAERVFSALSEGGTVRMPIQKTFWAARFGMVVDRFGTPWIINCEKDA